YMLCADSGVMLLFVEWLSLRFGRPTTSTVFPYTTLFRSGGQFNDFGDGHAQVPFAVHAAERRCSQRRPARLEQRPHRGAARGRGDRKSTRLNSSHVKTSYAVFCLKKKTINYTTRP